MDTLDSEESVDSYKFLVAIFLGLFPLFARSFILHESGTDSFSAVFCSTTCILWLVEIASLAAIECVFFAFCNRQIRGPLLGSCSCFYSVIFLVLFYGRMITSSSGSSLVNDAIPSRLSWEMWTMAFMLTFSSVAVGFAVMLLKRDIRK